MRKKINTNWINFDFLDFPEKEFLILRNKIFPKNLNTNWALLVHLIDMECFLSNYESDNFLDKLNFLKNKFWISANTELIKKLISLNLKILKK